MMEKLKISNMNIKVVSFFFFLSSVTLFADEKEEFTIERVLELRGGSQLQEMLEEAEVSRESIRIEDIEELLAHHADKFFGKNSDISKFDTLKDLLGIIPEEEKKGLFGFLRPRIAQLTVDESEPKNWAEIRVSSAGGSLGLLLDFMLSTEDVEVIAALLDDCSKSEESKQRLDFFFERLGARGKMSSELSSAILEKSSLFELENRFYFEEKVSSIGIKE